MFALCAVFGHPEAARDVCLMLHAMQHRIKLHRDCHIISIDKKSKIHHRGGYGQVSKVFDEAVIQKLPGQIAVGLGGTFENQVAYLEAGVGLLAYGGNLAALDPADFSAPRDEIFSAILVDPLTIAVRTDPWGFAPMGVGKLGDSYRSVGFATEQCALALVGAREVASVPPGCVFAVSAQGQVETNFVDLERPHQHCAYGQLYVLHPTSEVAGREPAATRITLGRKLARKFLRSKGVSQNMILAAVPDSGVYFAQGVSDELEVVPSQAIIRNHYLSSSLPHDLGIKYSIVKKAVQGKSVVLVEDSIIGGHVSAYLVRKLKEAGANEVHLLVGVRLSRSCPARLALQGKTDFLAERADVSTMGAMIGADSLTCLEVSEIREILGPQHCYYCMGGSSPVF